MRYSHADESISKRKGIQVMSKLVAPSPRYAVIITQADGTQNVVGPFDDELAATLAANGIETGTRFTQVTPMLAPRKPWDY